jgi:hypothetical protein
MTLQLEDILAGEGCGRREEQREAFVDRLPARVEKAVQLRDPRFGHAP